MKKLTVILIYILLPISAMAASSADTLVFKVSGNCEMCKERIEASLDVKGVKSADWNMETGMITVVYDSKKITAEKIHEHIAAAGYDTDQKKAEESVYKKLPQCCQYTRKKP